MEAIAFLPEVTSESEPERRVRLAEGLFLLPKSDDRVKGLCNYLNSSGFKIESGGIFLYFKGQLKADGTIYEIFQSYAHALTFYYQGRATCRTVQEIRGQMFIPPELYIDDEDKFGVASDDKRVFAIRDRKKIKGFYEKILSQLASKEFNPFINSFEFFGLYLKEARPKTRLLFLNICLESLILAESESEGVGFKLALRCAHLLNKDDKSTDKTAIFDQVNIAYNLRSKIIHGANYEKAKSSANKSKVPSFESDHIDEMEKILKRIYRIVLGNKVYYEATTIGSLGKQIDQSILTV